MKNKTDKQIFSENLTELLKSESMSKTQLAQKIGVNASTVTNWCKGKMFPRYEMLEAIARVFHIETHELLQNKSVLDCALEDFNERFLLPEPGFDEIFEKVSEINEEAYLNGHGWAALIESYLENNYPELYEDYDSDPEAGGYVGRYFGNTKENWEKIRKVAEIVEDLIENEDKIYKYIEENGDDIFWDSF